MHELLASIPHVNTVAATFHQDSLKMEWFKLISISATVSALVAGIVGFLFKQWIAHERDAALERMKSELSKLDHEHRTRFTKLHEDRAEIIKRLYALIHKFFFVRKDISAILSGLPGASKEHMRHLQSRMSETRDAFDFEYRTNRIFFTPQQNDLMDEVLSGMTQYELALFSTIETGTYSSNEFTMKSKDIILSKFGPAQRMLEKEFRSILGVEVPDEP